MTVATASIQDASPQSHYANGARSRGGQWLAVVVMVVIASLSAGFYGVNDYAGNTDSMIRHATVNAERFETVYRDMAEARLNTLRMGIAILVEDPEIISAFAHQDRPALMAKVVTLFTKILHDQFDIDQLNFFTPPAKGFLRANDLKTYGNDNSAFRKTVVTANERLVEVAGMGDQPRRHRRPARRHAGFRRRSPSHRGRRTRRLD